MRGALLAREVAPSAEMDYVARAVPFVLSPLLVMIAVVFIQATDSYFSIGAAACGVLAVVGPAAVRVPFGALGAAAVRVLLAGLVCMFLELFLRLDGGGNRLVREAVLSVTAAQVAHFVLAFAIKYNTLTVIMADFLLLAATDLYREGGRARSGQAELDLTLRPLLSVAAAAPAAAPAAAAPARGPKGAQTPEDLSGYSRFFPGEDELL